MTTVNYFFRMKKIFHLFDRFYCCYKQKQLDFPYTQFGKSFKGLSRVFQGHLMSSDLQFGFKKRHSTSHAVFVMKKCVDYYVERGSRVFVTLNHHVFSKNDDISVIFIKKSKVTSCILLQHPGK